MADPGGSKNYKNTFENPNIGYVAILETGWGWAVPSRGPALYDRPAEPINKPVPIWIFKEMTVQHEKLNNSAK